WQLRPAARVPVRGAQGHADRLDRRAALREKACRGHAARGASAPHRVRAAPGGPPMKRALLLVAFLGACATAPSAIEQSREHYTAGRGDEALTVLEQAMR